MPDQAEDGAADLVQLWEEHIRHEFSTRNTDETLKTMVEDAYVDHVPVLTGGCGPAPVLLDPLHPKDAARHGDDSGLSDHRR